MMTWDMATNVALAPSLYETDFVKSALILLERDRESYYEEARRFGMHHPFGKQASRNAKRIDKMVRACKKAL